ncbi:ABC transporter substrate-binding protein [Streptomyces sp. C11-1]|uniref:ABC transporter substrate-binding protein n=1 Tax=Streptomyces durocortorensis TaxID=2811104 RepID=A0ABY9W263_9ACTN|nr:ABC transporter substrate-binding protein [Streptomyces durocortorensis]WNF28975.1 ABC transporter substrate-binding protein [Streptomyces durocortorensis]
MGGYRLLGRLGAGGMGVVYLGRSVGGGLVALKLVQAEFAGDVGFRERFVREVGAARRVVSRWAVAVTDADVGAVRPWLVTPFVAGPSLQEAVVGCGVLPVGAVSALGGMVAEALVAVHGAGLVHRDVKPANILLALDGPRLIDFGIARALDDTALTSTDVVVGSPGFLSPEQARADADVIGPPSDVFSLGCVLAYAATGRRPFGSGPPAVLLYRTVHDAPDLDGVPQELRPLLEECLAKDPEQRPDAAGLRSRLLPGELSAPGPGWLPEPVLRLVTARAAAMLDLPGIPPTEISRPKKDDPTATGTPQPGDPPSGPAATPEHPAPEHSAPPERPDPATPTRRRFLTVASAGGAVLAAGGFALWRGLVDQRDTGRGPSRVPPRRTIAVHADLSGPDAATGKAQERGARLAVEQFNAGPDRPFTLALTVRDDAGDPARAVEVAEELTAARSVLAVVGPTTGTTCKAAVGTYSAAQLPLVSVSVGTTEVSSTEHTAYLRTRATDAEAALVLIAHLVGEVGARRTALVHDEAAGDDSWDVLQGIHRGMESGGHGLVRHTAETSTEDFGPLVGKLLDDGVDALVFGGRRARGARFARALRQRGFTGARLGTQALLDPGFPEQAGAAAEGWVLGSAVVDATGKPEARDFTAAHQERYGDPPALYAAEAFDTVHLIAQAVRALGEESVERRALARRLPRTSHRGVSKTFTFREGSAAPVQEDNAFLIRVEEGRFRYLGGLGDS